MNERDDDLAVALGRSLETIPAADAEAALTRVTARSRVVRRRRAAARFGVLVATVGATGVLWLIVRPPGGTQVDTVDSPSTASSLVGSTTPTTQVGTTTPTTSPTSVTAPPSSLPDTTAATVPTGVAPPVVTSGSTAPTSASPPATSPPPPSAGPSTHGGVGGQVTVRVDAGSLVLVDVQATSGYSVTEQKTSSSEIEVAFEDSTGLRTRVKIRLQDGVVSAEVQEDGSGSSGGGPGSG